MYQYIKDYVSTTVFVVIIYNISYSSYSRFQTTIQCNKICVLNFKTSSIRDSQYSVVY